MDVKSKGIEADSLLGVDEGGVGGLLITDETEDQALLEWIQQGRGLTSKKFAKRFPDLARKLRQGKIKPEDLVEKVNLLYRQRPKTALNGAAVVDPVTACCHRLVDMAIPHTWRKQQQEQNTNSIDESILDDFCSDVCDRLAVKSKTCQRKDVKNRKEELSNWFQEALEQACRAWAPRLDSCFREAGGGGQSGSFLQLCPLYGLSREEFTEVMNKVLRERFDENKFLADHTEEHWRGCQLEMAVKGATEGIHEIKDTCWECEVWCKENLQQCSRCRVACYCGRHCQLKAWKGGHKQKCNLLREQYAKFEPAFKIVDAAHETGTLHGIHLSYAFDYHMAKQVVLTVSGFDTVDGPTMKIFYANLGSVKRGEWWFYDDADTIEIYNQKYENFSSFQREAELEYFQCLALFLCFDYKAVAASNRPFVLELNDSSGPMLYKKTCGYSLPVERFLEIYKAMMRSCGEHERAGWRSSHRIETLKFLRKEFHK